MLQSKRKSAQEITSMFLIVLLQNFAFAASLVRENDAGNGEKLIEDLNQIKKLADTKKIKKNKKKILKLLDEVIKNAAESCVGKWRGVYQ